MNRHFPIPFGILLAALCSTRHLCMGQDSTARAPAAAPSKDRVPVASRERTPISAPAHNKALAAAAEVAGVSKERYKSIGEIQLSGDEDKTPFLHDAIVNRPVWWATTEVFSLALSSTPDGWHDKYSRTLDVYLDPESGRLLKVSTRWPDGEKEIAPEPDAANAAWQLQGTREMYHGIPEEDPPISFLEAIDVIQRNGGNPLVAKQISGVWVVWSRMDKEPRPMWVITLRGIPPVRPHEINLNLLNHMRYIVDPVAKKVLMRTTDPQPIELTPRPDNLEQGLGKPNPEGEKPE